jgi:thioredoxin reductase
MREVTILGAGEAGLALASRLREKNAEIKIILIDENKYYFDRKEFLSSLSLSSRIDLAAFAQNLHIEFIQSRIEKINCNSRKIYFKVGEPRDFDTLIVATGVYSKKIGVKGEHREGFFYLSDIEPFRLKELLKISTDATVYVSTILGARLALALRSLGKEVTVVANNLDFLDALKERMIQHFKEKNIALYLNASIEEAIGEATVKATKIVPLKVFSSQLVFIDSGFLPNHDIFSEECKINDIFFSDYEGVYFLGDTNNQGITDDCFYIHNQQEAKEQASLFADFILGGPAPVFQRKLMSFEDKIKIIEELFK